MYLMSFKKFNEIPLTADRLWHHFEQIPWPAQEIKQNEVLGKSVMLSQALYSQFLELLVHCFGLLQSVKKYNNEIMENINRIIYEFIKNGIWKDLLLHYINML